MPKASPPKLSILLVHNEQGFIDHLATGAKARSLRSRACLSLRHVAEPMGVCLAYVSDLERGRRPWNNARALAFEQAVDAGKVAYEKEAFAKYGENFAKRQSEEAK